MNFKNKFNVTTNKFYMIFRMKEGEVGKFLFTHNGSISDYFADYIDIPLVTYAGKAIKAVNRTINEKLERLSTLDENTRFLESSLKIEIAGLSNTVNKLSKYNEYDLVGIYEKDDYYYEVVDYKKVEELVMKDKEYKFVEISKEIYTKLAVIENKKKTQEYNKNKPKHAHSNKQDNRFIKSINKSTSSITDTFLDFFCLAVICAVVATLICLGYALAYAVLNFLII